MGRRLFLAHVRPQHPELNCSRTNSEYCHVGVDENYIDHNQYKYKFVVPLSANCQFYNYHVCGLFS